MISKRNIVPILGAGFSMGSKARNGFVPSAKEMEPPPSLENKKGEPACGSPFKFSICYVITLKDSSFSR